MVAPINDRLCMGVLKNILKKEATKLKVQVKF